MSPCSPPPPLGPPPPPPLPCFATAQLWRRSPCTGPSRGPRWGWRTPPPGSGRRWRVRGDSGEISEEMATEKKSDIPNCFSRPTVVGLPGAPRRPRRIRNSRGARVFKISPLPTYPPNRYRDAPLQKKRQKALVVSVPSSFMACGGGGGCASLFRKSDHLRMSLMRSGGRKRRGTHISVKTPFVSSSCFRCIVHISIKCTRIVPRLVEEHECIQSDRRHKADYYILRRSLLAAQKIKQFPVNKTSHF